MTTTEGSAAPEADAKEETTAAVEATEDKAAVETTTQTTTADEGGSKGASDAQAEEENQSSEERIRGGGKVKGERGRTSRRHQPYKSNNHAAAAAAGNNDNDDRNCRVYVGNLSWNVSWQDLKDHMKTTGHIVKTANIMTTPDGRSKGCGIVEFASPEGAQQAVLTLNDTELDGRQIFVREDREDKNSGPGFNAINNRGGAHQQGHRFTPKSQNRRVYVGNLSWNVSWQDLKDHMRSAGSVLHAEVISESGGRSKGCGIVEYASAEEAQQAIATLTDTDLKGRMIFVREDRETSSGPPGGSQGHHSDNCSVYVWNLSYETSWQDLKDHMRQAGNVEQATILSQGGTSKGCGVVVYQRPQDAARAIRELQNSDLGGRNIYIREDRNQGGGGRGGGRPPPHGGRGGGGRGRGHGSERAGSSVGSSGCQLFVNNLSYDTTWRELKDMFRQCGDVERAEVMTNAEGRSKGFGTVRFFTERDAEAAIQRLNGAELQGRTLEVRHDAKAGVELRYDL